MNRDIAAETRVLVENQLARFNKRLRAADVWGVTFTIKNTPKGFSVVIEHDLTATRPEPEPEPEVIEGIIDEIINDEIEFELELPPVDDEGDDNIDSDVEDVT